MHNVYLDIDHFRHVTAEAYPDDPWSRDSTDGDWSINYYQVSEGETWRDGGVVASVDGPIYAVCVTYGTGDSFGSDGGYLCLVDVFSDEEKAKALLAILEADDRNSFGQVTYVDDLGNDKSYYTGTWKGYFEWVDRMEVVTVRRG